MQGGDGYLTRPVDPSRDHVIGPPGAAVTVVEYADFTCPQCRQAHDILDRVGDRLRGRFRFVFRHFPLPSRAPGSDLAARAAAAAGLQGRFWEMHEALYRAGAAAGEGGVTALAEDIGLDMARFAEDFDSTQVRARVQQDYEDGRASGVMGTPTFFINGRRYDGAWDEISLLEAVERPLGERIRVAAHDFFNWAAAAGLVLILATLAALVVANTPLAPLYGHFQHALFGFTFDGAAAALSVEHWINDGLMTLFFLLIGIEIKREILVGELSRPAVAALPVIGALGGMAVPAAIYAAVNWGGSSMAGWGVPMATDIAFTLGLMALLGRAVPASLKVFVAALAIADDLGAILVIAVFYTDGVAVEPLAGAGAACVALAVLNLCRVYRLLPYLLLGAVLWVLLLISGLHATLAGIVVAAALPSRPRANLKGVAAQTAAVLEAELARTAGKSPEQHGIEAFVHPGAMRTLANAFQRLRAPAYHLETALQNWSAFLILPLFAFFNTGITLDEAPFDMTAPATLGIVLGLCLGKPLGIVLACWLAVRARIAHLSSEISWPQMIGAGCLAGVGFTMSIFIAGAAFSGPQLAAVKLAVLLASVLSAAAGMAVLAAVCRK